MNLLLGNLDFVRIFLDDILIFSKNTEHHKLHVKEVLNSLKSHEISINFDKSNFFLKEVQFLGYLITNNTLKPDISNENIQESQQKSKNIMTQYSYDIANLKEKYLYTDLNHKIIVPDDISVKVINQIHTMLGHCRINKLYYSIKNFYLISNIKGKIKHVLTTCSTCMINKRQTISYGKITGFIESAQPLKKICSDILGSLINQFDKRKFYILTITDVFSRYTLLTILYQINTKQVIKAFENWFHRFKRPKEILTDQGRQYISEEFNTFCRFNGIKHICTSVYNPTGNSILERANQIISSAINIAEFTLNNAYNRITELSPEEIIFNKSRLDLLERTRKINLESIATRIKQAADSENQKSNAKRKTEFVYEVGNFALVKNHNRSKLDPFYIEHKEFEAFSGRKQLVVNSF
ncbi:integrase core domain-containing protein [Hamiltosporidium magnivora]|uniref:Integrase core domain-containing protein n=1 Tax=Hamiltosporidium magnivora TaxID=148818 RepID=A0A4V2JWL7_9MICR|nr:integrase core domain-containing protein [Hamiltosporidium magnivora]